MKNLNLLKFSIMYMDRWMHGETYGIQISMILAQPQL